MILIGEPDCSFLVCSMLMNHTIDSLRMKLASLHTSVRLAMILLNQSEDFSDRARLEIRAGNSDEAYKLSVKAFSHANRALRYMEETRKELDYDCIRIDEGDGVKFAHRS